MSDPTESFIDAIADAVVERLPDQSPITLDFEELGIEPMKCYTAKQTADFLGCHKVSVYQIPENELPKQRRAGNGVGYYGINILLYQNGLPPVDLTRRLEEFREVLMRARPAVQPLHPQDQEWTRVV